MEIPSVVSADTVALNAQVLPSAGGGGGAPAGSRREKRAPQGSTFH